MARGEREMRMGLPRSSSRAFWIARAGTGSVDGAVGDAAVARALLVVVGAPKLIFGIDWYTEERGGFWPSLRMKDAGRACWSACGVLLEVEYVR